MRDLIFFSLENWDEVWRRNQFVCAELARRFPKRRILFVGKPVFLPQLAQWSRTRAGRAQARAALSRRFWRVPELPNVRVFNPIKPLPNPAPGGRAINENWQVAQVKRAARRAGIRDPLLWINPYDSGFYIGRLGERGVTYDITDDWELMASSPEAARRIAAQDRRLCERADLTIVCSRALYDSRRDLTRKILLLPNGVDAAHYQNIETLDARAPGHFEANGTFHAEESAVNNGAAPDGMANNGAAKPEWPRPVFGYTGTLHRERVDLEMVVQLARAHPAGSVVLVGPQHWTDDSLQNALKTTPNLHAPGPVAYDQIPAIMAGFDVCIVPHRQSGFVESLNPIKLWEYLAAGKPIVSTDVAGFRDYPQLVRLAHDAREFIAACREALREVNGTDQGDNNSADFAQSTQQSERPSLPSQRAARRAAVAQHSWKKRVDALLECWRETAAIADSAPSPHQTETSPTPTPAPTPAPAPVATTAAADSID